MVRLTLSSIVVLFALGGCNGTGISIDETSSSEGGAVVSPLDAAVPSTSVSEVVREHVVGDVFHYSFVLRLGDTPNAHIRIHRVVRELGPWHPRHTAGGVMMLHGDFATFTSNFAPVIAALPSSAQGMAVHLAANEGLDVWGFDRRWALAPAEAESRAYAEQKGRHEAYDGRMAGANPPDFADMGVAQELGDIGKALEVARALRIATGSGGERLTLIGYSHGGQLSYAYASFEATKPERERHVKNLVPLDIYAELAPEDDHLRKLACRSVQADEDQISQGIYDSPNAFVIDLGTQAMNAPDGPADPEFFPGLTNRGAFLLFVTQTYTLGSLYTPYFHSASGILENGISVGFRNSPEEVIEKWYAGAPPHESLREDKELNALWCGDAPLPVDVPLARIRIPLFYVGMAGGFGEHGIYSTTRVSSKDVTTLILRQFSRDREGEDYGHGDVLYAREAPTRIWGPVATWIRGH